MEQKNLIKVIYESLKTGWNKFWEDDVAVGLTALVLFMLAAEGPLYKQQRNEFVKYKKLEQTLTVQKENQYMKNFKEYIKSLPKEQRDQYK